jgi:16S rRNA (cytosine967-C5)-methyltransferase
MSSARETAFDVIRAVGESDAYANLLLPGRIRQAGLTGPDAALATELCYGTLRMQGYYDRVIAMAAGRDVEKIDAPILDVLRLGAHQLLATRIPAHAAVNESVALARKVGSRGAPGFCNGVLRTIGRSNPEDWRRRVLKTAKDGDDRIAAEYSHPAWIVRAFRQSLAAEGRADELEALLGADNAPARVNLVALPGLAVPPDAAEPDRFSPHGFVAEAGDPQHVVESSGGTIRVQDEGSQLAALALVAAGPIAPGERWLDLCAAPGGKAALLGAIARQHGARLVANEISAARARLVRSSVAPLGGDVEVWERDGRDVGDEEPGGFDRVLLDAPCTGLGALRRRPEARWRKQPRDVGELSRLQEQLLDAAVAALKPGGVLAYVTCSPHLGETRSQVAAVLKRHGDLAPLPTGALLDGMTRAPLDAGSEQVQLWPHRHGTDAMFIALLRKADTP